MMKRSLAVAALATVAFAGVAEARDQIRIVGSSTVFPFASKVVEQFGKTTSFKTPVIESTGSGGGLKLFCAGVGVDHPDITNASRAIKASEVATCAKNGVTKITEITIGFDGIVVADAKNGPTLDLTRKDLYLALAKMVPDPKGGDKLVPNPYKTWKDVNKALPANEIEVLGPPPTSGTRDAFTELVMDHGCESFPFMAALKKADKKAFKASCRSVREDGAYIEAGENDTLIVNKLVENPKALGIFGFSFLDQNADKIKGAKIDGVVPTFENISSAKYPVSRSLYFYVKGAHVGVIPGIKEYVAEFTSEATIGPDGYLPQIGLIPLPADARKAVSAAGKALPSNVKK
ncbi:MAG: substrate-binding domain-containing protein [Rhodospirillaceae bacterium]|nr:substrate-binding domain-containing protein [Rhodospirillaceae bacterium]